MPETLTDILLKLYERDLNKLKAEIELYANEEDLWSRPGGVPNAAGNLCLHISGNLQHFLGAVLGSTGYIRDRDSEFSRSGVSKNELQSEVDAALSAVKKTLSGLSSDDLAAAYPIDVFGEPMTTGYFLTHLATHLSWHLGQISYHRRMVSPNP